MIRVIAIRSLRMQTSTVRIDQYLNNNISGCHSWLNVTDTALENMKTILTDVRSEIFLHQFEKVSGEVICK